MIINKLKRYIEVLTPQNPDSIISAADHLMNRVENYPEYYKAFSNWIVKKYEPTKTTLMDPEAVFVHMIQNYFTHEKALWADSLTINTIQQRAFEMAQSLVGKDAPNVISTDTKGNKKELLDMKAPYLVVYMFNPDCEHCQEQTPKLIDYYKKMNGEIDVMAIAIETEEKLWKDYVKKTNMPFTSVFDPTNRSIYAKYYVDITPELYVINPDRKIIGKNLKVFQIQTIIDRDKQERGVK
jgi:peroxiredoxin